MHRKVRKLTEKNVSTPASLYRALTQLSGNRMDSYLLSPSGRMKTGNPDTTLTGGTGLFIDVVSYVKLVFNIFLINRNNKLDRGLLYY